jgi:hypothetical protein
VLASRAFIAYITLAYQRLQELYEDAAMRRSLPSERLPLRLPRDARQAGLIREVETRTAARTEVLIVMHPVAGD